MTGFHGPSLGPFQWDDPLLLESQLTEDERMIRDTAREVAAKELRPRIERAYLEEKTDPALFRIMGEAGLIGVTRARQSILGEPNAPLARRAPSHVTVAPPPPAPAFELVHAHRMPTGLLIGLVRLSKPTAACQPVTASG